MARALLSKEWGKAFSIDVYSPSGVSAEKFAQNVKESYPFHPAIRDLYARFKENQGFQQTRGLIRLMRIVASRIWRMEQDSQKLSKSTTP